MGKKQIVNIDFYRDDNLPIPLVKESEKQGIEIKKGLIAVKTIINSPLSYDFTMIGKTPTDLKNFFHDLAAVDDIDLNEVAKNLIK